MIVLRQGKAKNILENSINSALTAVETYNRPRVQFRIENYIITFAKETAREVFLSGDIPVCPHLMFTPFVDLRDSVQNQAARVMGLRLMETCQQVNVYGPVLTPEMQAETQRAHDLGIPVIFDQKRLEKTRPRPKRGRAR